MDSNNIDFELNNTLNGLWRILVYSENRDFLNHYSKHDFNEFSEYIITSPLLINNENEFQKQLLKLNNQLIIHIDCNNKPIDWMLNKVSEIRNSKLISQSFITIWSNKNWEDIPFDLIKKKSINEIRAISSLSVDKVQYILFSNLQNHKQILELIALKNNLENQINLRTETLTKTNKKLQTAIIQNSNTNTKLHQQKLQIETQNNEIQEQNLDLKKSFKKSSKQHIKLYKFLHENEQQKSELENALKEIKENNKKLQLKHEEIISKNDRIEQQREEIQTQMDTAIGQRDLITVQQSEIEENITYARHIQKAMLTPKEMLDQLIPNHFVLNLPKAIVSGDFFWVTQNRNYTVIAVADCTGHGISGAMMSMLGIAFLNEIINNNDIIEPDKILAQLRERIILSLHQEYSHDISFSRDGMDISICVIDIIENTMDYSGANNPIYIIRDKEIFELKPDKMPIGIHEFFDESFTKKQYKLQSNDTIYMFSDGYADQFGGAKGKKMKYPNFKNRLIEANNLPIREQEEFLKESFIEWKGKNEQIDDVIVLGYQFT